MPIIGPSNLPVIMRLKDDNPLKLHVMSQLGHPLVHVELADSMLEQILRSTGDFVAHYFPLCIRYAFFMTQPLQAEYPIPDDAYWIKEVNWSPTTTRIDDIFGAESFLFNIGNISGLQNMLLDYTLLQMYRRSSARFLGTEGQWEFHLEDGEKGTIRLFPVPKGSFPVVVEYLPSVTAFKSPQAREITYRAVLAQMKIALGNARAKISSIPGPDGSAIQLNGQTMLTEGKEEYEKIVAFATSLGEPLPIITM